MYPPKIKRRRMAELEPWIEKLIQNYGQSQCETTVKANVVGVSSFFLWLITYVECRVSTEVRVCV